MGKRGTVSFAVVPAAEQEEQEEEDADLVSVCSCCRDRRAVSSRVSDDVSGFAVRNLPAKTLLVSPCPHRHVFDQLILRLLTVSSLFIVKLSLSSRLSCPSSLHDLLLHHSLHSHTQAYIFTQTSPSSLLSAHVDDQMSLFTCCCCCAAVSSVFAATHLTTSSLIYMSSS